MTERVLANQVALVTGAGSGLGEATAHRLAGAGACVACIDLDPQRADCTARALSDMGANAIGIGTDVSKAEDVRSAIDQTVQTWQRLDVAVNCAGVDYVRGIDELTVEQWDNVLGVNLRGPFLVAKAVFPIMRTARTR